MSEPQVTLVISIRAAGCLNNAIRREMETIERRRRAYGSLDGDHQEYLNQLDSCCQALAVAFGKAIQ